MWMLNKLLKLANYLDENGFAKEADQVDALIKVVAGRHELFRALKNDDAEGAKKAMTGMSNEDLGLGSLEYKRLFNALNNATDNTDFDSAERERWMGVARKYLGIEKPEVKTTQTHNPITGLPWSSGKAENKLSWEEQNFVKNTMGIDAKSLENMDLDDIRILCGKIDEYVDDKLGGWFNKDPLMDAYTKAAREFFDKCLKYLEEMTK